MTRQTIGGPFPLHCIAPVDREVIEGLETAFVDLSIYAGDEKERLTLEAMQRGERGFSPDDPTGT